MVKNAKLLKNDLDAGGARGARGRVVETGGGGCASMKGLPSMNEVYLSWKSAHLGCTGSRFTKIQEEDKKSSLEETSKTMFPYIYLLHNMG